MTTDRLDAIIDRLDALLAETDDPESQKDIREIQQLVIGVRAGYGAETGSATGCDRESASADED
jgi:hypothetical protein